MQSLSLCGRISRFGVTQTASARNIRWMVSSSADGTSMPLRRVSSRVSAAACSTSQWYMGLCSHCTPSGRMALRRFSVSRSSARVCQSFRFSHRPIRNSPWDWMAPQLLSRWKALCSRIRKAPCSARLSFIRSNRDAGRASPNNSTARSQFSGRRPASSVRHVVRSLFSVCGTRSSQSVSNSTNAARNRSSPVKHHAFARLSRMVWRFSA